jgi:hypothetical protein
MTVDTNVSDKVPASHDSRQWTARVVLSIALMLLPFIPLLRSIPCWTGVYRLI